MEIEKDPAARNYWREIDDLLAKRDELHASRNHLKKVKNGHAEAMKRLGNRYF